MFLCAPTPPHVPWAPDLASQREVAELGEEVSVVMSARRPPAVALGAHAATLRGPRDDAALQDVAMCPTFPTYVLVLGCTITL